MSGKYGDWGKLERMLSEAGNKLKAEAEKVTDQLGAAFVGIIVRHFEAQDLGWPPLNEKYAARKAAGASTQIRKMSKREILSRINSLGIAASSKESKGTLADRLAVGGNQILVASGTLMENINYQKLGAFSGYVGVLRREKKKGYDLAWIHEFGSRDGRVPARPFMRPSIKEFEPIMVAEYQAMVDRVFR